MKILVLCDDLGKTAPGIVYERIIGGLSNHHEIFLITSDLDSSLHFNKNVKIVEISRPRIPTRVFKFLMAVFSISVFDLFWVDKVSKYLKSLNQYSPDIILSLISNNHYSPIIAGNKLSLLFSVKHFTYSVDAIPAPIGWMKNDAFFLGIKKFISRQLSKVDGFFSANPSMLAYQMKLFKPKKNIITDVIYNPTTSQFLSFENQTPTVNTFLYTGGIYGPRKVTYILEAFKKTLESYPNSTLEFVGSKIRDEEFLIFSEKEKEKVIIHPFSRDLTPFLKRATALIDIDSDLENDIFISSKIINYLNVNRLIISQTGKNSPSKKLFQNIPSIFQCYHDAEELANAMKKAIIERNNFDFNDRKPILQLFQIDSIVLKMNLAFDFSKKKEK